jgi:hypothetical protein
MRISSREQPPEDSPVPGVIPGTVHVHNEPDHAHRTEREPEPPTRPRPLKRRLRRLFGRGHRS